MWRAYRPAPVSPEHDGHRRCGTKPKITRHDAANGQAVCEEGAGDFEHVADVAARVLAGATEPAFSEAAFYEVRECSRCLEGRTYDGQRGEWVACEQCSGTGHARVFVYPRRSQQRLQECAGCGGRFEGRELVEVTEDHESLTWFVGDELCWECASAHGVL